MTHIEWLLEQVQTLARTDGDGAIIFCYAKELAAIHWKALAEEKQGILI